MAILCAFVEAAVRSKAEVISSRQYWFPVVIGGVSFDLYLGAFLEL